MKWQRMNYTPVLPLGPEGKRVTSSKEHIALARRAAAEGMVLLKNEGVLPLGNHETKSLMDVIVDASVDEPKKGQPVVLLGKGSIDYVKGGGGSGNVNCDFIHNLADGMKEKEAEGKVALFHDLIDFYQDYVDEQVEKGFTAGMMPEPEVPAELLEKAKEFSDTAVISISRFSGEGWDRVTDQGADIRTEYTLWPGEAEERELSASVFEDGDFYLTKGEKALVEAAKKNFDKIVVVMNVGGMVDSNWFQDPEIDAVLMSWQGGMAGGDATADVLCGDVNPSGKLTDTFAKELGDYPSSYNFHNSADYVEYTDDIYVGYRYFETIPGAQEKVNYPFGFGLSYTTFDVKVVSGYVSDEVISFDAEVTNTGKVAGKEVVQLYYSAPQGLLKKPARALIGFAKTKLLRPGKSETLHIEFDPKAMASYDELGLIDEAAWVLEAGTYDFYLGTSVRDAKKLEFSFDLGANVTLQKLSHKVIPHDLKERLLSDGSMQKLATSENPERELGLERQNVYDLEGKFPDIREDSNRHAKNEDGKQGKLQLIDVFEGKVSMEDFLAQLPIDAKIDMLGGQPNTGVANTYGVGNQRRYGIPNVMTADGPAGLRVLPHIGVHTTAWPVANLLASTWDVKLVEQIGTAIAEEVKENNIGIWLAPACNIHRSPLCGRNFEYYSEDPFLSGKMGIAVTNGAQKLHIGVAVKHFAANNKETNRKASNSVLSERALREIYIKQFEMIVKEANPYMIMSSYNKINGVQASENKELLTDILRGEWGYDGVVCSDWWTLGEHYMEVKAGNDLKMANGYPERVREAFDKGFITEEEIDTSVRRILNLIMKMD